MNFDFHLFVGRIILYIYIYIVLPRLLDWDEKVIIISHDLKSWKLIFIILNCFLFLKKTLTCTCCGNRLKIDKPVPGIVYCRCKGKKNRFQARVFFVLFLQRLKPGSRNCVMVLVKVNKLFSEILYCRCIDKETGSRTFVLSLQMQTSRSLFKIQY